MVPHRLGAPRRCPTDQLSSYEADRPPLLIPQLSRYSRLGFVGPHAKRKLFQWLFRTATTCALHRSPPTQFQSACCSAKPAVYPPLRNPSLIVITEINAASGVLRRQVHEVMENSAPDPKTSNEKASKLTIQNQISECRQIVPDLTIRETILVGTFARHDGKQVIPDLTAYLFGKPDLPGTAAVPRAAAAVVNRPRLGGQPMPRSAISRNPGTRITPTSSRSSVTVSQPRKAHSDTHHGRAHAKADHQPRMIRH